MRRGVWLAALVAYGLGTPLGAQNAVSGSVQVEVSGREPPARILIAALAAPHDIMLTDSTRRLLVPRGTTLPRTTIIIGGDASVGAGVRGDIIVVGGDLFLSPGAAIDGSAIAIGGAVYGSTLAAVAGGTHSFRDATFDATNAAGAIRLQYRSTPEPVPGVEFPLVEGLRMPIYDRVQGLSLLWGPVLRPTARLQLDPTITYRSHIGAWDPGLEVAVQAGDIWSLTLDARRTTLTNDAWIQTDLANSLSSVVSGVDSRNYYRADRGEITFRRVDRTAALEVQTTFGVNTERAWSVGSPDTLGSPPWTLRGPGDADNFERANPPVRRGRTSSAFVGSNAEWMLGDVRMRGWGRVEVPWQTPGDVRFVQVTLDGTIQFPTFGVQRFRTDVHAVVTPGDTAPPQRFAYLGGTGTLPVMSDLLSLGGDQLFYVDSRYDIPIQRITLPFVGSPMVTFRHRAGSAGIQGLPRLIQNIGASVSLSLFRVEYAVDPATRKQSLHAGLTISR
jgi:hypothetical protein